MKILQMIAIFVKEFIRYLSVHMLSTDLLIKLKKNHPEGISREIIVSLTTIPDRINHLRPVLNSLIDQSLTPRCIYLVIPSFSIKENKTYVIPEYLKTHPLLKIVRTSKDWGPATKFLPVHQKIEVLPKSLHNL